jgi:DNA-binding SARP family transcriptional activator
MDFRVLGTIEVGGAAAGPSPPGAKERAILARLLLDPGRTVPADALLEAGWEGVPRAAAARSLAVRVANLRAYLEPGRDRGAPSSLLVRDGPGYRLQVAPEQVDAHRFERCVRAAAGLPAAAALELLDGGLALWRGPPFGELADAEFARSEVRRLEDLRAQAEEARARALVDLGRPLEAVAELRRLAAADPLREELVRTLMVALYAAGRQVEALEAYRELAGRLRELGLAPGAATRALERRILDHDATLSAPAAAPPPAGAAATAPSGREPELARLRAALARALGGRRSGVLAWGEPGAGKTTLVDAFLHEATASSGAVAGVGQCLAQRGPGEPYMPVLEALGALARGPAGDVVTAALARHAPTWLVELPWLLGEGRDAEAARMRAQGSTRARMLREVLEALDALCAAAPLVLVLEDLHWADDSTLDLVDALLRRREQARFLLVGTFRPEGGPAVVELAHELGVRGLCEVLPVARLTPAAVAAHLELRFPSAPLPDGLADVLARRSGGNPLFMRNLLEHWLADGTLTERSGALALARPRAALEAGVPPTLRAHIRDQLARLDSGDAELLAAASVAGRDFSADTVAAALERDRDAVAASCAELARRTRLIERSDGGHAFPHDLHREVLYELLAPDARARLHARVGAHLADSHGPAASGMAAELGFHFLAGRDPERAVRWLRLAAERAFGRSAHAEGIRHLRSALDAAAGLEAGAERMRWEVELLSSLGQALVATGGWSATDAEDALMRARSLAAQLSDNEPLVSVLLALATLYELRGEFGRASDMAQECERLAPSGNPERELESAELLACNLFHQGSFARALEYADRGVELLESGAAPGSYTTFPATLGDNAGVSCHDWAGLALWFLGRPDSALARATNALELARDPSRAYSLATASAQMAVVHQCRREPEAALEWAEATIATAEQLGYVYREAMGRVLRGWALAMLGDAAQGVREISAGLAASRGTGARMDDPHYLALLAEAHLRAGEPDAGLAAVAAAMELARRERSLFYEPELHRLGAALHAAAGRADVAVASLRLGLARAREQGSASLELRIATDLALLPAEPAAAADARAAVAAAYARFEEGLGTSDLRAAAAVLERGAQAITPAPASASTSTPSATR